MAPLSKECLQRASCTQAQNIEGCRCANQDTDYILVLDGEHDEL